MGRVPVLVISGPVGVGKTSVANEVSHVLSEGGVAHTLVDLDVLAATFPRPPDDPFHGRLALRNLGALWANAAVAGARNLVMARVIEHDEEVAALAAAIPGAELTVVRLTASDAQLLARVERREQGGGLAWHRDRALELARLLESAPGDVVVDTAGRGIGEVAREVAAAVDWETG
jgi:hypothetical protein